MLSIALAATKTLAVLALVIIVWVLVACAAWQIVYYGLGCRKAPIQKAALLSAAIIWVISAAVINLM